MAITVMGPTASGKTGLAIELRKHLPVELINVDSAQVYRYLNIGSAKPDAETLAQAPHRLLDIRDPCEIYSAAEFLADARREMAEITASGRIPLLVGGSMMYFKVLLEGLIRASVMIWNSALRKRVGPVFMQSCSLLIRRLPAVCTPITLSAYNGLWKCIS